MNYESQEEHDYYEGAMEQGVPQEEPINPLHISLEAKLECDHLLHQELQKARHDWLREEIVKLEGMKQYSSCHALESSAMCEDCQSINAYNSAIQTIIDRYQSELDQAPEAELDQGPDAFERQGL